LKYFFAFIIVILVHSSIYLYLDNDKIIEEQNLLNNKKETSKIQYVTLKQKAHTKAKNLKKKITKSIKKQQSKTDIVKSYTKPKVIKKIKQKTDIVKSYTKPKPKNKTKKIDKKTKQLLDLYKDSFDTFDKQTKIYLINNIKTIASITKRFLEYPYLSIQANQSGVCVVEFYLYPNGTISDIKVIKSSRYFLLDDNTIETIKEAYSDYPRPSKNTLIKILVTYNLNEN
jgi:TonB family protein